MARVLTVAAVGMLVCAAPISAQDPITLDRAKAAAAFGARERVIDASLSPDGKKVAMVIPGPKQSTVVQVLDMVSGSATPVNYANGDPMTLSGCGWASNTRLLCTLYGVSDQNYGQWLAYSRLIAMSADGSNPLSLGIRERQLQYAPQSDGYVVDWRDGSTDQVLIARQYVPAKVSGLSGGANIQQGLGVDLINTGNAKVTHVESPNARAGTYLGDGRGTIRIMGTDEAFRAGYETRGETSYAYRVAGSREWRPFSVYSSVAETGLAPIGVDGAANVAYALRKLDGRDALYRVALDGTMKEELVLANPRVDIDGIVRVGRSGRIVGASFAIEKRQVQYFDPKYEKLMGQLARALPNLPMIRIVDSSADETKHLVYGASDVDPGRYFLYDITVRSLTPLGADRPELAGVAIGSVKPITYKAADGTDVPGYLTLPPGSEGKKLPAVVMPHGGPAARDEWGFDWLAQFFVSRGYAVLQPNYRGSSGYGQGWFQENGFRSWKTAISDVNDAGRWLVSQGIADPSKLAIVGWSYGGYAALQSNVLDPKLFKAIVAIAPVTDLGMLRAEKRGFTNSTIARDFIGDGPHVEAGSPARHAGAFTAPVLMFHGDKDINVGIAESEAMDRALKKAGKKSELIAYRGIDHQLRDSAVRVDMLTRIDTFLDKSLGS